MFTSSEHEGEGDLDADHRLILRSSQPLLKSRNSGVVLGVCALHYYCGSHNTSITQQVCLDMCECVCGVCVCEYVCECLYAYV